MVLPSHAALHDPTSQAQSMTSAMDPSAAIRDHLSMSPANGLDATAFRGVGFVVRSSFAAGVRTLRGMFLGA